MSKKRALITGITGQDGSYLARFLLAKGYEVHGIRRRVSVFNTERIDDLYSDPHNDGTGFFLHYADLSDAFSLLSVIQRVEPDEIYNLAAMSHVGLSFEQPDYTGDVVALGTMRILEAVRILGANSIKIYQASSSELYGDVREVPQTEKTPFYPRSPYAVAKLYAYWITVNYREAYGLFASNGILFNHESPLRGETFVTRKITRAVARMKFGLQDKLFLGNLDAKRDWGHAKDFVKMMWMILQAPKADDWVIATGTTTSVREFLTLCFKHLGVDLRFSGEGVEEKGYVASVEFESCGFKVGQQVLEIDPLYYRPAEVDLLVGDSTKARNELGWTPEHSLDDLINEMMVSDLALAAKEARV